MLDKLGKKEELEYREMKFTGKYAGKSWEHSQCIDGLIRTRAIIFIMVLLVFYPMVSNYIFHDYFSLEMFIERVVYSVLFLIAGMMFNKYRMLSTVIAMIPMIIILLTYLAIAGQFSIGKVGFSVAIIFILLSGVYYHYKGKRLRKELDQSLLENQLIE